VLGGEVLDGCDDERTVVPGGLDLEGWGDVLPFLTTALSIAI
tara:strand:+ start:11546 stop:11671 length:126 start_codon:yes stop_codon:yes gene_type:complete